MFLLDHQYNLNSFSLAIFWAYKKIIEKQFFGGGGRYASGMWKFPGPGIKPAPQKWPEPQQ